MINIAIDGPAGAGKSTIARRTAANLGYIYVDTGALYRAVGVSVLRRGLDTTDAKAVAQVLNEIKIELKFVDGVQHVFLNGEDVSTDIRLPEASMAASNVSAIPAVRAFLFDLQKSIAANSNCIMDGRDIGTVVLPDAQLKVFLTASAEVRAKRRYDELVVKGTPVEFNELLEEIKLRDHNDSTRAIAPLKKADDAVLVDSSDMTIDEVCETLEKLVREIK
ncbi:MAG: (d)CMP kinase [Clostridia bacterium]|nr:(d)CMP kinase [Clostridia bacterium]MBR3975629.1 (d)CMP kinase [Clostridia bacterium]